MAEQVEAVKLLTSRGAFITAQDINGQTSLHFAALNVSHRRAHITPVSCVSPSLSHTHTQQGSYRSLKLLLSQCASFKVQDMDGR